MKPGNMKSFNTADVVICGAGSAGVAAAYFLAQRGITDLLIIDKNAPLSQTSAKSGENYRNWWPNNTMARFMNRSIDLMDNLASASNNIFRMEKRGYLYLTQKSQRELQGYLDYYQQFDVGAIRIHGGENDGESNQYSLVESYNGADVLAQPQMIQEAFPHVADLVQSAIHVRRAGSVSAQQLGMHLLDGARQRGVKLLTGDVTGVEVDGKGVKAVEVVANEARHRIQTRIFVNAAGPFAPEIAALFGVELPVFSVLQQKIAIQDVHGVIPRAAPFTIVLDEQHLEWTEQEKAELRSDSEFQWLLNKFPSGLHVKPEGGRESTWIKLGWAINRVAEQPVWEPEVTPEFPDVVLRGATNYFPGLGRYLNKLPQPVVRYSGYYTKTKENLPLIGPMGVEGAYIVGALSGFGTMASCAAGELVAAWIAGANLPDYAKALSLDRYACATEAGPGVGYEQSGEL